MGFEALLEPIFGEPKAEWSASTATSPTPLRPHVLHVYALDPSRLTIHVTDFHSSTWEALRSVQQLEDLRDSIGIRGSWSEFLDYVIASMKSEDLKLVLEGQSNPHGAVNAKLIAQKSKGMPRISIPLTKLVGDAASEAMSNFSLELFKSFKSKHSLLIYEQDCRNQLTRLLSAEQEKNENIQKQLDLVLNSKRLKSQMSSNEATSGLPVTTLQEPSAGWWRHCMNDLFDFAARPTVGSVVNPDLVEDFDMDLDALIHEVPVALKKAPKDVVLGMPSRPAGQKIVGRLEAMALGKRKN
ncbi:hypothetical protein RJ640_008228 [Escallonia rubra]|uniref:Uncharacterized protein n=1 Tax=Escallonia rubra TaxID=112253 RepID=A0AA88QNM5_9ASTE|nr:hypothetical protein RJ640_008228 [Escallonia rubra]